jgi:hypothetical protein
MMNKDTVLAILDFIADALQAFQRGHGWRWFKQNLRREVWKPYIKPLLRDQDWSWVPEALGLLALIRALVNRLLHDDEFRSRAAADPDSL